MRLFVLFFCLVVCSVCLFVPLSVCLFCLFVLLFCLFCFFVCLFGNLLFCFVACRCFVCCGAVDFGGLCAQEATVLCVWFFVSILCLCLCALVPWLV
jgi:hypothetical protein